VPRDHRAPPARPEPPGRQAHKDRLGQPDRKERRDRLEPSGLPARPVRLVQRAVSVQRGPPDPRVRLDRRDGLHAISETACDSKCELLCSAGEKLVSVTCPGGTIWIGRTAQSEMATCSNSPGPALALCMKH
jgi:hypothetical protein